MTPRWPRSGRRLSRPGVAGTPPVRSPDRQPPAPEPRAPDSRDESLDELRAIAEGLLAHASELRRQTEALAAELGGEAPAAGDPAPAEAEPGRDAVAGSDD